MCNEVKLNKIVFRTLEFGLLVPLTFVLNKKLKANYELDELELKFDLCLGNVYWRTCTKKIIYQIPGLTSLSSLKRHL